MTDPSSPEALLARMDLNAVVTLGVLLRERSVTRTASALGVTQSAVSHALRRLRETLGDPLLVRTGATMTPTPRAERLERPLRAALRTLAETVTRVEPFEPATSRRTFQLVAPDLVGVLVFPALLACLEARAPLVSLHMRPGFDDLATRLAMGELDLAIAPRLHEHREVVMGPPLGPDLRTQRLLEDRFAVFARRRHPAVGSRLSARAFAALRHVLVAPAGDGEAVVDRLLGARGLRRHVVLRVPEFATAIAVVRESDLVLVAPRLLRLRAIEHGVEELEVSLRLPRHSLHTVWHPRYDGDAAHAWLRQQLLAAVEQVAALPPRHRTPSSLDQRE